MTFRTSSLGRAGAIAVLAAGLASGSSALAAGAASHHGVAAVRPHNALANAWIKTLNTARTGYGNVLKCLKALPSNASNSKVYGCLAPVNGLTEPIERALPVQQNTLEGLGLPSEIYDSSCGGPISSTIGASGVTIGGTKYHHGIQLVTGGTNCTTSGDAVDEWSWHLGGAYTSFRGKIGLDSTDSNESMLQFLNAAGKPIPFTADGVSGRTSVNLVGGNPNTITLNTSGLQDLVVSITVPSSQSGGGTVDIVNDAFVLK